MAGNNAVWQKMEKLGKVGREEKKEFKKTVRKRPVNLTNKVYAGKSRKNGGQQRNELV